MTGILGEGLIRTSDHRYYWNGTGPYPGVTTVTKMLDKSDALMGWAKREVAACAIRNHDYIGSEIRAGRGEQAAAWLKGIPDVERDKAADLGTRVHYAAEQLGLGGAPVIDEDAVPFVNQYLAWRDDWQPAFVAVEYRGINLTHGYGGTGDLIVVHQGETWLLDIKTGGYYDDTSLQLVACAEFEFVGIADDPSMYPMPPVDRFGVLDLKPDRWSVVPYDFDRAATFRAFTNLVELCAWRKSITGARRVKHAWTGKAQEVPDDNAA